MNERIKELAEQAGFWQEHINRWLCTLEGINTFEAIIRADEREKVIGFIREYPYWLGDTAKKELISAIRARGNT
jgi:hypothetical protein